jgi:hypothetical protein
MAPKKKPKAQAQPPPAAAATPTSEPESAPVTDLSSYSEVQQNEFLATEAIYPDGFERVHGRRDAWKVSVKSLFFLHTL